MGSTDRAYMAKLIAERDAAVARAEAAEAAFVEQEDDLLHEMRHRRRNVRMAAKYRQRIAALEAENAALRERAEMATEYTTPEGIHISRFAGAEGTGWIVARYPSNGGSDWMLCSDGEFHQWGLLEGVFIYPTADAAFDALAAWKAREGGEG